METKPIDIKLPVSSKYLGAEYPDRLWDDKGMFVCLAAPEHVAVIKVALNTHPQLLEALEKVRDRATGDDGRESEWWMSCPDKGGIDVEEIDKLIALATGSEVAE